MQIDSHFVLQPIVVGNDGHRSPAYEEGQAKDQDRAIWVQFENGGVGCVCDGTSSSLRAERAADRVTSFIQQNRGLWPYTQRDRGIDVDDWFYGSVDRLVSELEKLRAAGEQQPVNFPADRQMSDGERSLYEENIRSWHRSSYQTTIVVAQMEYVPYRGGTWLMLRYFKVGDSELLVFAPNGKLLETTANLVWDRSKPMLSQGATSNSVPIRRRMQFAHVTQQTDVLPDSLSRRVPHSRMFLCPSDVFVLLASDGLLDAFDGPSDLFSWLREHEDKLTSEATLDSLHQRLQQRRGDDDVSFVWVPPGMVSSK